MPCTTFSPSPHAASIRTILSKPVSVSIVNMTPEPRQIRAHHLLHADGKRNFQMIEAHWRPDR